MIFYRLANNLPVLSLPQLLHSTVSGTLTFRHGMYVCTYYTSAPDHYFPRQAITNGIRNTRSSGIYINFEQLSTPYAS